MDISIFLIKMASRHARSFGRKEKSRTHLHRPWSNFWSSYSYATTLSSTGNIISRSKALLWVTKWHQNFMGRLEGQLWRSVALRPFSWLRFIDDIDMKWSHGRGTLTAFLDEATTSTRAQSSQLKFPSSSTCFRTPNQVLWAIQYLLICIQNQQIHTSISCPQVASRYTAAKMFLTALHFASNVSAPIRTLLNQEQKNWLTTSANGNFHLPMREHGNRREKTNFLIALNLSRAFFPSCWLSPRLTKSEGYSQQTMAHHWVL